MDDGACGPLAGDGREAFPVMVWTPAQLGAFLDAAESDRLYAIFHVIAHHGLRRGEAVGMDWENVNYKGRTVGVAREIVRDGWTPSRPLRRRKGRQPT